MPTKPEEKIDQTKKDLEIERIPADENKKGADQPLYKNQVRLTDAQIERLRKEIFAGYKRIEEERQLNKFYDNIDTLEAQYYGEMEDDSGLEFNQNVPITQVKVDSLVRLAIKAFFDSDPKFDVSPRPGFAKKDKWDEITTRQSGYLDYKLDEEIDLESPMRKAMHQAVLFPVGLIKMSYEYMLKARKREESFSGRVELKEDGQTEWQPGLVAFLKQYPDAIQPGNEGHAEFRKLMAREDVTFKASFMELVYDDPNPSFVDIRDLFVPLSCEGYNGLCEEKLYIERQHYTWWKLKKMEANEDFINVNDCKNVIQSGDAEEVQKYPKDPIPAADSDYRTWDYTVLEATYWFNLETEITDIDKASDNPETEIRIKCWFDVCSKAFLGAIYYPYDAVDSDIVPIYCEDKKPGFYKGEFAKKLTSSHLTQNSILNLLLTEAWMELTTTPITEEGSPIIDQFLNKRWKPGVPLELPIGTMSREESLGFLDKPQKAVAQQLLPVLVFLGKMDDDRTGFSAANTTGRADPIDPAAPAAKTAMLLQQSGINIDDYIKCMLPSFNRIANIILQLTYQMSKGARSYRARQLQGKVVSGDIFGDITRDDMVAKTSIQSRAASFAFDKLNEKKENIALFSLLYPVLSQTAIGSPEGVYTLVRQLLVSWSPQWKNKVDNVLPDPQTFQAQQFKLCVQALDMYFKQLAAKAKVTGVAATPDLKEFLGMAAQLMKQAVAIPPKQEKGDNA